LPTASPFKVADAAKWSEEAIRYFQEYSQRPIPAPGSGPRG
jgi:hypothetical protein